MHAAKVFSQSHCLYRVTRHRVLAQYLNEHWPQLFSLLVLSCLGICIFFLPFVGGTFFSSLFLLAGSARTHLYPTFLPVPSRSFFFPPLFRRDTKEERTTTAADRSCSFLAGPHQGRRRNAARTALELLPGITTYFSGGVRKRHGVGQRSKLLCPTAVCTVGGGFWLLLWPSTTLERPAFGGLFHSTCKEGRVTYATL